MTDWALLNGIVFGLVLAAPVGPVGVLCVSRTLTEGRMHGLLSGLGAAIADAVYGGIAAFGISSVSTWVETHKQQLALIGGVLLILLAIKSLLTKPRPPSDRIARRIHTESLAQDVMSTFTLAITNPVTVLAFAGLIATFGAGLAGPRSQLLLVVGVFAGSAAWWFALSGGASIFREYMNGGFQRWANRVSAVILLGFGFYALLGIARGGG